MIDHELPLDEEQAEHQAILDLISWDTEYSQWLDPASRAKLLADALLTHMRDHCEPGNEEHVLSVLAEYSRMIMFPPGEKTEALDSATGKVISITSRSKEDRLQ